jgi:hypothetical protein
MTNWTILPVAGGPIVQLLAIEPRTTAARCVISANEESSALSSPLICAQSYSVLPAAAAVFHPMIRR